MELGRLVNTFSYKCNFLRVFKLLIDVVSFNILQACMDNSFKVENLLIYLKNLVVIVVA